MTPLAAGALLAASIVLGLVLRSDGRSLLGLGLAAVLLAILCGLAGRPEWGAVASETAYLWVVAAVVCSLPGRRDPDGAEEGAA